MGYNRKNLGVFRNFIITTWKKKKKKKEKKENKTQNVWRIREKFVNHEAPPNILRGWYKPVNR